MCYSHSVVEQSAVNAKEQLALCRQITDGYENTQEIYYINAVLCCSLLSVNYDVHKKEVINLQTISLCMSNVIILDEHDHRSKIMAICQVM